MQNHHECIACSAVGSGVVTLDSMRDPCSFVRALVVSFETAVHRPSYQATQQVVCRCRTREDLWSEQHCNDHCFRQRVSFIPGSTCRRRARGRRRARDHLEFASERSVHHRRCGAHPPSAYLRCSLVVRALLINHQIAEYTHVCHSTISGGPMQRRLHAIHVGLWSAFVGEQCSA